MSEAQLVSECATLLPPEGGSNAVAELLGADSLTARVMSGPNGLFGYNDMWNRADVLQAEMPSSNGVGDARSLARFYAAVIDEAIEALLADPSLDYCSNTLNPTFPEGLDIEVFRFSALDRADREARGTPGSPRS